MPKLDLTKPVQTRSGLKVTILATEPRGNWPVIGLIHEPARDTGCVWTLKGAFRADEPSEFDLEQVPMTDEVRERALDMLAALFNSYENGPACYESPDDCAGYLGNAVQIDNDTFHVIASFLNVHRPVISHGITAQAKKEAS